MSFQPRSVWLRGWCFFTLQNKTPNQTCTWAVCKPWRWRLGNKSSHLLKGTYLGSDWRPEWEENQVKSSPGGGSRFSGSHVCRAGPTGTQGPWAPSQTSFCHAPATKVSVSLKIHDQPANVNPHCTLPKTADDVYLCAPARCRKPFTVGV